MSKTIIVGGFGPGISTAVAEKFGGEGFSVALVGRNNDRLAAGAKALQAKGIKVVAFPADLSDPVAARGVVVAARAALGPITVLQWSAYNGGAGDLLTADPAAIRGVLDVAITGFLAAMQEALPDLRQQKDGAVLITNGGLLFYDPKMDAGAVEWGAMGLSIANAAKHKMVGMLAQQLKPLNVYVGEVVVTGTVKGSAFDRGQGTLEPAAVAEKFWGLYRARTDISTQIP
jgi:NADP-dependent 3-hydroxy acid dehydrogenase YdfG